MKKFSKLFSPLVWLMLFGFALPLSAQIQVGSGTTTTTSLPIVSCFGYNYSQQIYYQTDINSAGTITSIAFFYVSGGTTYANWQDWVVYMGHTTKTAFASTTDWEPLANLTQVYSGVIPTPVPGTWVTLVLDTPFAYNNTDNLIIAVDENTANWSCSAAWNKTDYTAGRSIYYRNDSTNPDPAAPPTATGTLAYAANVVLGGLTPTNPPNCTAINNPADGATGVNEGSDLFWAAASGSPTGYRVSLGTTPGGTDIVNDVNVGNALTYDIPVTLSYNTTYYGMVTAYNNNGDATGCDTTSFTTRMDPTVTAPYYESFEGFPQTTNATSAMSGWTATPENTTSLFRWQVDNSGSTGSSGTGPDGGASDGIAYFYTEASSGATGAMADLESPPVDLSALSAPYFFFDYHMAGATMGTMEVQVWDGAAWNTEFTLTGPQHVPSDPFSTGGFSLAAYTGMTIKVRFVGTRGTSFDGDMCIDNLKFDETIPCSGAPHSFMANNVTQTSADIEWTPSGTCTVSSEYWVVLQDTLAPTSGTGTAETCSPTFPINARNLTSETTYYVWVAEYCTGDTTWTVVGSFTTLPEPPVCVLSYDNPTNGATGVASATTFMFTPDPAGGTPSSYDVFLGQSSPDSIVFIGNVAGQFVITGLDFDSTYYWYVVPINAADTAAGCDANVQSFTVVGLPAGPSGVSCNSPYNPGVAFADEMDSQGGWTGDIGTANRQWRFGNTAGTSSSGTGPSGPHSGTSYVFYEASVATTGATDTGYLYSPAIDLSASYDAAELSFWLHANGAFIGDLDLAVATDSVNGTYTSIFGWAGYIQGADTDPWHNVGLDLTSYIGQTIWLRFEYIMGPDFTGDIAIDLMEINSCVSCPLPTAPGITANDPGSQSFAWGGTVPTSYNWVVVAQDSMPAAAAFAMGTETGNSATATGLAEQTTYWFYVQSDCGGGFMSGWAGPVEFTTPCDAVSLPYEENFDATTIPACMETTAAVSGVSEPFLFTTTWQGYGASGFNDHTGNGGSAAGVDGSGTNGSMTYLFTPTIDLGGSTDAVLNFWSFSNNTDFPGDNANLNVAINDGSGWNTIETYAGDDPNWVQRSISLSTYSSTIQVRFNIDHTVMTNSQFYNDVVIDDIFVGFLCNGTPTAGTAQGPMPVCSGDAFSVTLDGATAGAGISYQWEESADDVTYSAISGATNSAYAGTFASEMYYRAIVTCDISGLSDTSSAAFVMQETDPCICPSCASNATSALDTKIDTIAFNGVAFGSDPSAQESQTSHCDPGLIWQGGSTVDLRIVNGSASGNHYAAHVSVYADWNLDGNFDTLFQFGPTTGLGTIPDTNFVVPTDVAGDALLRVVIQEGTAPPPACGTFTYGETEDFKVVVDPTCDDAITGVGALVLDSTRAAIYWDVNESAGFFKFQYREAGTSAWTLVNVKNQSYQRNAWIIKNLTPNTTYQYRVRQQCPLEIGGAAGPYSSIMTFTTFTTSPCEIPADSKIVYTADPAKVRLYIDYEPESEKYDVRWQLAATNTPAGDKRFRFGTTVISGLAPNTEYRYRIRTQCSGVWTAYSGWTYFTTNDVAPPAPRNEQTSSDVDFGAELAVFPNPTKDVVYVSTSDDGEKQLRVMDMAGRMVINKTVQGEMQTLDMAKYPAGAYFFQVIYNDGTILTEKVVKN